ncbi:MAG: hypothetical protein O2807_10400 [bacterium]|nr:hypothetical protein [bacterium]
MADLRAQWNEEAVGANHATKADVVNRLQLAEHNSDGTHKTGIQANCRLDYVGATSIKLSRFNGKYLPLVNADGNAFFMEIPAAGVTLTNGGLSANTTYNIYAYDSSGTMTLEASATAHAVDATTGVRIKSGDATRTLVGKIRTDSSSQFKQTSIDAGVLSYFNRKLARLFGTDTSDRTSTSTTPVAIGALNLAFLSFGDGSLNAVYLHAHVGNDVVTLLANVGIGFNSTTAFQAQSSMRGNTINDDRHTAVVVLDYSDSEGYHTCHALMSTQAGGTVDVEGATTHGTRLAAMAWI